MSFVGATCVVLISAIGVVCWSNFGGLPKEGDDSAMGQSESIQTAVVQRHDAGRERDEIFRRQLEARNAASTAEHKQRVAQMHRNPVPVLIPLSPTGELSASAIVQLGISGAEAAALRKVILEFVSYASADLTKRAKLVSAEAGEHGLVNHYYARASKDRGESVKKQISERVATIIGDSRAAAFVKGLDDLCIYGGFGQYDVDVTLYSDEQGRPSVNYQFLSPESGAVSRFGGGSLDDDNFALWRKVDFSAVSTE